MEVSESMELVRNTHVLFVVDIMEKMERRKPRNDF